MREIQRGGEENAEDAENSIDFSLTPLTPPLRVEILPQLDTHNFMQHDGMNQFAETHDAQGSRRQRPDIAG